MRKNYFAERQKAAPIAELSNRVGQFEGELANESILEASEHKDAE